MSSGIKKERYDCYWKAVLVVLIALSIYFILLFLRIRYAEAHTISACFQVNLREYLGCRIDYLIQWSSWNEPVDFFLSQLISWVGISASIIAAILVGSRKDARKNDGESDNNLQGGRIQAKRSLLIAFIAAVPTATITIQGQFNFEARSQWDTIYNIKLHELRARFLDKDSNLIAIAHDLYRLMKEMEVMFPYSSNVKRLEDKNDQSDADRDLLLKEIADTILDAIAEREGLLKNPGQTGELTK